MLLIRLVIRDKNTTTTAAAPAIITDSILYIISATFCTLLCSQLGFAYGFSVVVDNLPIPFRSASPRLSFGTWCTVGAK